MRMTHVCPCSYVCMHSCMCRECVCVCVHVDACTCEVLKFILGAFLSCSPCFFFLLRQGLSLNQESAAGERVLVVALILSLIKMQALINDTSFIHTALWISGHWKQVVKQTLDRRLEYLRVEQKGRYLENAGVTRIREDSLTWGHSTVQSKVFLISLISFCIEAAQVWKTHLSYL